MKKSTKRFCPLGDEHLQLEKIAKGKRDISIDISKIADLMEDNTEEEVAQEVYLAETMTRGRLAGYYDVMKPEWRGDRLVVTKELSELGKQLFATLEGGIMWSKEENKPDLQETTSWYESMMKSGSIEMRYVELIIANKCDDLKDLRSQLIYFRMRGERDNNSIVSPNSQ